MPAPSQLSIATASVSRLLKEEQTYRVELIAQEARVAQLKEQPTGGTDEDASNRDFVVKQEEKALAETRAVFGPLRERIADAVQKLETLIAEEPDAGGAETARVMIAQAKKSLN